jgi:hypothetical protein
LPPFRAKPTARSVRGFNLAEADELQSNAAIERTAALF